MTICMHSACAQTLSAESEPILPDMVLPELAYMVLRELGYGVLVDFLHAVLRGELKLERATEADLQRTAEILRQYADSHMISWTVLSRRWPNGSTSGEF